MATWPLPSPPKRFKAYEPGFVHIDVKYLPKMQDEASRKYLFVVIDRATRWVYLEIRKDKHAKSAQAFIGVHRSFQRCRRTPAHRRSSAARHGERSEGG